ncbi:transcriptional regulator, AbrB family [Ferroglobus placidus DSM 10642]|uniref:Transcriptional regulator, AbrB family n=1 Tax=Ferroglobus placidus (strain DSM 10642 / AEDII12DO) TaxID=589924 RepID=D3RXX0_FERPA|nr:HgcAB-associated protein [Ferroglobus placidus]ADC65333.1 transcriptional regulator, AbrB family [Ferroglobus placidus DSM 10642]
MKTCKATKIEAVLTVDSKGQILLPKELREKANLKAGDRIVAITGCDENGEICCFILVKAELVDEVVSRAIAPLLKEVVS